MTRDNREALQEKSDTQERSGNVNARRRRLLIVGASSPLLLTIASRPAWAQGGQCTASAMASANASGGQEFIGCSISAGWWKNFKDRWPISHTTAFHERFAAVEFEGSVLYSGLTLGEVIDLNGGSDPIQGTFGFHLVGALMNALMFPPDEGTAGYAFTSQQIIDTYNGLYGAPESSFVAFKTTLEDANNQFDSVTDKPEPW